MRERLLCTQKVTGLIPVASTTTFREVSMPLDGRQRPVASRFADLLSAKLDEMDPERKHAHRDMSDADMSKFIVGGIEELEHITDIKDSKAAIDMCVTTAAYLMLVADKIEFSSEAEADKILRMEIPR